MPHLDMYEALNSMKSLDHADSLFVNKSRAIAAAPNGRH